MPQRCLETNQVGESASLWVNLFQVNGAFIPAGAIAELK
jgi:hypothetical protein